MKYLSILSIVFLGISLSEAFATPPLCPKASMGKTVRSSIWAAHDIVGAALEDVEEIKTEIMKLKGEDFERDVHWCRSPSQHNSIGYTEQQSVWATHNLAAILKSRLEEIKADIRDLREQQ